MPENSGVLDSITHSVTDGSDQESSSSFNPDEEYAAVTKGLGSSKVQKKPSLGQMKGKFKKLQSLVNHYRENEAALESSTKLLSSEIMDNEIKMASLYGKMKSVMDENNALKKAQKSFSKREMELLRLAPNDKKHNHDEDGLLVNLKKEICAKLHDYNNVQSTVNTKLDEIHGFYEKYYEGLELNFDSKVFEAETSKELAKVKRELKNVKKNSQIKVDNLKIQLLQATKSLELLKKEVKAKDDYLKGIPKLVDKTNRTLLSYKKSIANQKETIEALQAELSHQSETQRQMEPQDQVRMLTNVTLVDPFEENHLKNLFSIQEKELQELRLHKKICDEKKRTTHLHLEKQNSTIKLLQSYVQLLVQRLPPTQGKHHLNMLPVGNKCQELRNEKPFQPISTVTSAPRSPPLLLQHSYHQKIDSTSNRLLLAAPDGQSRSEKNIVLVSPKLNPDYLSRVPYFSKLRPPHIISLNSLTLKTLPKAPKRTHADSQQLTDDDQPPPKDKSQENAKEDDLQKLVTDKLVPLDTSTSPEVQNSKDSNHSSRLHK